MTVFLIKSFYFILIISDNIDVNIYDLDGKDLSRITPIEEGVSLTGVTAEETDGQTTIIFQLNVIELSQVILKRYY